MTTNTRRRPSAYARQSYVKALDQAVRAGVIPTATGVVYEVIVGHDDDCPKLKGGLCNCEPILTYRPVKAGGE
jgi:hypothetical protein